MTYENDLANALRERGASESEVAAAVDEVRLHLAESTSSGEAEFGPAQEYAAALRPANPRTVRTPGRTIAIAGVILAVVYVVVAFAARPLVGFDLRTVVGPAIMWPALAIVVAALAVGVVVDRSRKAPKAGASRTE